MPPSGIGRRYYTSRSYCEGSSGEEVEEEEGCLELQDALDSKNSDRKLRLAFLFSVNSVTRGMVHIETEGGSLHENEPNHGFDHCVF